MITNVIDQLKRDEGFRPTVYDDSRGFKTLGYGHNLDAHPLPDLAFPITEVQATQILGKDVERISTFLQRQLPWITSLDEVRHGCLTNMAFNLGVPGLLDFHHDLADTQAGNYAKAAQDMKASEWYTEVGERAQRLCQQMETGVWQ